MKKLLVIFAFLLSVSFLVATIPQSFADQVTPSGAYYEEPVNWDPDAGPYSILGKWKYSGSGGAWIEGYGQVVARYDDGKLEFQGTGTPGDETVTYVKDSFTLSTTASEPEHYENEGVTNFVVENNYAQKENSAGLNQDIFLLSDDTLQIHRYGTYYVGYTAVEDFDVWISAVRDEGTSGGGGGGCTVSYLSISMVLILLPLGLILRK